MSEIFVFSSGNGYAYVDIQYPYDGQQVHLSAVPDLNEQLLDIQARDHNGYAIALATVEDQDFIYQDTWGDMTIEVYFSGSTPPPPPPPQPQPWMWAILKRRKRNL